MLSIYETSIDVTVDLPKRHDELHVFLEKLEKDGWILKEGGNGHLGTYTKNNLEFFYHESHDDETKVEFTLKSV